VTFRVSFVKVLNNLMLIGSWRYEPGEWVIGSWRYEPGEWVIGS